MAVHVSFLSPAYVGIDSELALGKARSYEAVTVGSTTADAAEDGEFAFVVNGESDAVTVATGSTPDASAASATNATSAAMPIPAGGYAVLKVDTGDKIDTAAV